MKHPILHPKTLRDKKTRQNIVAYVVFTTDGGMVMSVDLFRDYGKAAVSFHEQVRREFAGIRRDTSQAINFHESVTEHAATLTWQIQEGRQLTNHFCHAELGETSLDLSNLAVK